MDASISKINTKKFANKDINFMDIIYKMNQYVMQNNCFDPSIEKQKELVDSCLKKYTIEKLQELNSNKIISDEAAKELSMIDLFEELASIIPKEKHFDTLRFYTHYVLEISGSLQGWCIPWSSSEEQEELEAAFNMDGKWNELKTPLNEDYVNTFKFVYDVFQNRFMVKYSVKKITSNQENNQ